MEMSHLGQSQPAGYGTEDNSDQDLLDPAASEDPTPQNGVTGESPSVYTRYLVLAACTASLGGILFGYDLGIISAALIQLRCEFNLTDLQKEWVVTSMLAGAFIASLTGGFLVDAFGRRRVILINSIIFIVGAAVITSSPNLAVLITGRVILGYAISLAAISETVYIAEIAPSDKRGRLVTLNELGIVLGFLIAYGVGYAFVSVPNGWRYMFGASALPAVLQGLGRLVLPASPRYLIIAGQVDEAKKCLRKLRGKTDVDDEIADIIRSISSERIVRLRDLLHCAGSAGRRLLIGGGLVCLQQLTGQPTILYYAPLIFHSLGFTSFSQATLASFILGAVKFIVACIALYLVDGVGRRRLLLIGVLLMTVSMTLLSTVITPDLSPQSSSCDVNVVNITTATLPIGPTNATDPAAGLHGSRKWFSLLGLLGYIAGYQFSFGPCTWIVLTEIYPSQLRGRAVALATSLNWGTNILISAFFLDVKGFLGVIGLFTVYAVICGFSLIFIFLLVPETRGRTLEEISQALTEGSFKNPREHCRTLCYSIRHPCRRRRSFTRLVEDEFGKAS